MSSHDRILAGIKELKEMLERFLHGNHSNSGHHEIHELEKHILEVKEKVNDPDFGLEEIKREIKAIECKFEDVLACRPSDEKIECSYECDKDDLVEFCNKDSEDHEDHEHKKHHEHHENQEHHEHHRHHEHSERHEHKEHHEHLEPLEDLKKIENFDEDYDEFSGVDFDQDTVHSDKDSLDWAQGLTTGPVLRADQVQNLLVEVLNNLDKHRTIRILLFDLWQCPKQLVDHRIVTLKGNCAVTECFNIGPTGLDLIKFEVELEVLDKCRKGIYFFVAGTCDNGYTLVNSNVFRHEQLSPLHE